MNEGLKHRQQRLSKVNESIKDLESALQDLTCDSFKVEGTRAIKGILCQFISQFIETFIMANDHEKH